MSFCYSIYRQTDNVNDDMIELQADEGTQQKVACSNVKKSKSGFKNINKNFYINLAIKY